MSANEDRMRERLIELLAKLDRIRSAAARLRMWDWTHGEDCSHRHCDDPDSCADGSEDPIEGCEAGPGVACDCSAADIKRLLAAIDGAA